MDQLRSVDRGLGIAALARRSLSESPVANAEFTLIVNVTVS